MSLKTFGQTVPSDDVISVINLVSTLNFVNLLDGPSSVSHAPTIPTTNSEPTLTQMQYYTYYAASMYCQYQLDDLSCDPCQEFINDVYNHTGGNIIPKDSPNEIANIF